MAISLSLSSSEIFTPSTLAALAAITSSATSIACVWSRVAPIARERRIEHLAEPVDDHRLLHLAEDAVVDLGVVVGRARRLHQRAARHQDDAAAELLDRRALLLVGADHVVDGHARRPARDDRCRRRRRSARRESPSRRRGCGGSVRATSASPCPCRAARCPSPRRRRGRGPEVVAEGDGALPVDRGVEPGIGVGQRIGDDMRGRIGDAVERRLRGGKSRGGWWCRRELPPAMGVERRHLTVRSRLSRSRTGRFARSGAITMAGERRIDATSHLQRRDVDPAPFLPALAARLRRAARPWRPRAASI